MDILGKHRRGRDIGVDPVGQLSTPPKPKKKKRVAKFPSFIPELGKGSSPEEGHQPRADRSKKRAGTDAGVPAAKVPRSASAIDSFSEREDDERGRKKTGGPKKREDSRRGKERYRDLPSASIKPVKSRMGSKPAPAHLSILMEPVLSRDDIYNSIPSASIGGVRIGLMSSDDIRNMGGSRIVTSHSYGEKSKADTIYDPRMGPATLTTKCETCDKFSCAGHFGYIELNKPCFNPLFVKNLVSVLKCICFHCGKLLIGSKEVKTKKLDLLPCVNRLKKLELLCADRHCLRNPSDPCPVNPSFAVKDFKNKGNIVCKNDKTIYSITVHKVKERLLSITKSDAELMGFTQGNHPVDFVLDSVPVLPNNCKSPYSDGSFVRHTYIASQLKELVKLVNDSKDSKIFATLCSMICKSPSKSNDVSDQATALDMLQGKTSLLRGNAMGKPGEQHLRTVSGPDSAIEFGQVRFPRENVMIISKPVVVTLRNLALVKEMCSKNMLCHYTKRLNRVRCQVHKDYSPEVGDTVLRMLLNGDVLLLNRQPTLHKGSVLAVRVVIGTQLTIGLHMVYTTPLNADFDGDENNIYNLHCLLAEAAAVILQSPKYNFVSVASQAPMYGCVINEITSAYLMSREAVPLAESDVDRLLELLLCNSKERWALKKRKLIHMGLDPHTTRGVLSVLLPRNMYYARHSVNIIGGILVSGTLTKSSVGNKSHSLLHEIYLRNGPDRAAMFITESTRILDEWFSKQGFSVGLKDFRCHVSSEDGELVNPYKEIINNVFGDMSTKLRALDKPAKTIEDARIKEMCIKNTLNVTKSVGMDITKKHLGRDNPLQIMGELGANTKGDVMKTCQMTCTVGQQYLSGKVLPTKLSNSTRILPCKDVNDHSPQALGFIKESFADGLTGPSLFFLQQGGREGLMDTSIQTARTGDMHRKMVRGYCNVVLSNDYSLRMGVNSLLTPVFNCGTSIESNVTITVMGESVTSPFDLQQMTLELNGEAGWIRKSTSKDIPIPQWETGDGIGEDEDAEDETMLLPDEEANLRHLVTCYEKAQLLGYRAYQLQYGVDPFFETYPNVAKWDGLDPVSAALREMQLGEYNMQVHRVLPNGDEIYINPFEDVKLNYVHANESWFSEYSKVEYNRKLPTIVEDTQGQKPIYKRDPEEAPRREVPILTVDNVDNILQFAEEEARNDSGLKESVVRTGREDVSSKEHSSKKGHLKERMGDPKRLRTEQRPTRTEERRSKVPSSVDPRYVGTGAEVVTPTPDMLEASEFYEQELPTGRRSAKEDKVVTKVRDANNHAKTLIINEAYELARGNGNSVSVLDACCGRGGDLFKWGPRVVELLGIDVSNTGLTEMLRRYKNNQSLCPQTVRICKTDLTRLIPKQKVTKFTVVSCMLGLNYMNPDNVSFNHFLSNISNSLDSNGIFILVYANMYSVEEWCNNDYCEIRRDPNYAELSEHGARYNFKLGDKVVDAAEYSVCPNVLSSVLSKNGLTLLKRSSLVPYVSKTFNWTSSSEKSGIAQTSIVSPNVEAMAICNLYIVEMWRRE